MKEKILQYIITNFAESENVSFEDNLLESGIIDSIGLMKLVSYIESEFELKIPAEELVIENFISVDAMEHYLTAKASS